MAATTYHISELLQIAQRVLQGHPNAKVFCFYGDMGTGKTTLIKKLLESLGAVDTGNSPSFGLVNEHYDSTGELLAYHYDFYRLEQEEEAYDMGIDDYFDKEVYHFIEWPERIPSLLPEDHMVVRLQLVDDRTRFIEF